ncbi:hypothetical protein DB30_06548 [Enhygromyxa salina]|uniref:Uncharacterized protein n=1 Tax=Enhygromyxa salina TaxID=215803 RepID=A0A0C2DGY7_9BACT|nr:hypothetical protein DB30_06548 [Enhygromyxa salina]
MDSVDFARAISTLGVDRGVDEFVRYGFQKRFGRMFFAVPLGRWTVSNSKGADLLAEIDPWLNRLRGFVGSGKAPASVASATRRLEGAIMEACQRDEWATTLEILIALGEVESTLGRAKDRWLRPLPPLSKAWFYRTCNDPSPEYRLAASLASAGIRPRQRPIALDKHRRWDWASPGSKTMTWVDTASLVENLLSLLRRREVEDQQRKGRAPHRDAADLGITRDSPNVGHPRCWASLADVTAFIDGPEVSGIDEQRLEALMSGLSLIDWARVNPRPPRSEYAVPPAGFSLLALAHGLEDPARAGHLLPATSGMLANAAAGRLDVASRLAIQRLRASGLPFALDRLGDDRARARRIAAALAFPLAPESLGRLKRMLFPRVSQNTDYEQEDVQQ